MSADLIAWIGSVTTLAGLIKGWVDLAKSSVDLKKSGLELQKSRESLVASFAAVAPEDRRPSEPVDETSMVISPSMLEAYLIDINHAINRFSGVVNDPRFNPAEVEREQERAEGVVKKHITNIKRFNQGALPTKELQNIAKSFNCE